MREVPECEENTFDGLHCPRWYGGGSCSYCGLPQPKAEPHPCRWLNGKCIDCGRAYGAPRTSGVAPTDGSPDLARCLTALVDQYWDLAYAEGKEDRQHDTPGGDAQRVRWEICRAIRQLADGVTGTPAPQQAVQCAFCERSMLAGSECLKADQAATCEARAHGVMASDGSQPE